MCSHEPLVGKVDAVQSKNLPNKFKSTVEGPPYIHATCIQHAFHMRSAKGTKQHMNIIIKATDQIDPIDVERDTLGPIRVVKNQYARSWRILRHVDLVRGGVNNVKCSAISAVRRLSVNVPAPGSGSRLRLRPRFRRAYMYLVPLPPLPPPPRATDTHERAHLQ